MRRRTFWVGKTSASPNGDEYSVYDEWSQKLYQVYMDYGTQITDAYMDYATN